MHRRIVLSAVLAGTACSTSDEPTAADPRGSSRLSDTLDATLVPLPPRVLGSWNLVQPDGSSLTTPRLLGRWWVVTIGYTSCPDVCPTTLMGVAEALDRWETDALDIGALFVAVDPARDKAGLGPYAAHFHPTLHAATGSAEALRTAVDDLGGAFRFVDGPDGAVDHSTAAFVIDPTGVVRAAHTRPADGALLAAEVAAFVEAHPPELSFDGWIRRPPPGAGAAAGYGTVRTAASTDRSVAEVHSPTLRSVHTHETVHDGAIATMRPATFTVPAHGSLQLRPGGKHLMIAGLPEGIDEVPLRFALDVGGGWFTVPVRSR